MDAQYHLKLRDGNEITLSLWSYLSRIDVSDPDERQYVSVYYPVHEDLSLWMHHHDYDCPVDGHREIAERVPPQLVAEARTRAGKPIPPDLRSQVIQCREPIFDPGPTPPHEKPEEDPPVRPGSIAELLPSVLRRGVPHPNSRERAPRA